MYKKFKSVQCFPYIPGLYQLSSVSWSIVLLRAMLSDKGCSYGWRWQAPEPGTQALENTTDKQFVKALAPSTQVLKITKSHIIWPNLGNFQQAIDIIFQVWEHAQKSKIFQPNKAYFLILLRIVFNVLNKNSLFHTLFLHFKYYKN